MSNIFNNNRNNFLEKPFEEKIKDPTWVKRNVRIMPNDYYENWISDYMDNISKINEVSKKSRILNIELISSCFEPKGLILKIGPYGYENSLRKEKDGITYFGYEEQIDKVNKFIIIYI